MFFSNRGRKNNHGKMDARKHRCVFRKSPAVTHPLSGHVPMYSVEIPGNWALMPLFQAPQA